MLVGCRAGKQLQQQKKQSPPHHITKRLSPVHLQALVCCAPLSGTLCTHRYCASSPSRQSSRPMKFSLTDSSTIHGIALEHSTIWACADPRQACTCVHTCLCACVRCVRVCVCACARTWGRGLSRLIMQLCQPRVLQCALHIDALAGVELQHPLHEVDGQRVRVWELFGEIHLLQRHEAFKQMACTCVSARESRASICVHTWVCIKKFSL